MASSGEGSYERDCMRVTCTDPIHLHVSCIKTPRISISQRMMVNIMLEFVLVTGKNYEHHKANEDKELSIRHIIIETSTTYTCDSHPRKRWNQWKNLQTYKHIRTNTIHCPLRKKCFNKHDTVSIRHKNRCNGTIAFILYASIMRKYRDKRYKLKNSHPTGSNARPQA